MQGTEINRYDTIYFLYVLYIILTLHGLDVV